MQNKPNFEPESKPFGNGFFDWRLLIFISIVVLVLVLVLAY